MMKKKSQSCGPTTQGALVSQRGVLQLLEDITKHLSSENIVKLHNSCFWHVFEVANIQFQGQLFHILLKECLIKESETRNRLAFSICGKAIEFSPLDYATITGLNFGDLYDPPTKSEIHSKVFNNESGLTFAHITNAFLDECKNNRGRTLLALKLAHLYILYGVILARHRHQKNIEMKYLHLADDLEKFNQYPWGRIGYEFLVRQTHSRRLFMDGRSTTATMAYDAYGYVLVLQIWAYEVMSNLGAYCAERIDDYVDRFPRILRWRANSIFRYNHLINFFDEAEADKVFPLKPTEVEWKYLHALGLEIEEPYEYLLQDKKKRKYTLKKCDGGDSSVQKNMAITPENLTFKNRKTARFLEPRPSCSAESSSPQHKADVNGEDVCTNVTLSDVDSQLKHLVEEMSHVKSHVEESNYWRKFIIQKFASMEASMADLKAWMLRDQDTQDRSQAGGIRNESIYDMAVVEFKKENVAGSSIEFYANKMVAEYSEKVFEESPIDNKYIALGLIDELDDDWLATMQPNFLSSSTMTSKIANTMTTLNSSARRQLFGSSAQIFDTGVIVYDKQSVKVFTDWHDRAIQSEPALMASLPIQAKPIAEGTWFTSILMRTQWLRDDHIDALLNLIIFKSKDSRILFLKDWTILEMFGTGILMQNDFEKAHGGIMDYVMGNYPIEGARSWVDASRVITVANVNKNHWICIEISLELQRITVFDSDMSLISWEDMKKALKNMSRFVPWLCKKASIWEKKGLRTILRNEWEIVSFEDTPQQKNSSDCGIMAIKFAECLVSGHAVSSIDPDRCGIFRKNFCTELYHLGLQTPAEVRSRPSQ